MTLAEEIVRRLGRAANAGQLREPMRLNAQFKARLDDGRTDGIVSTTGAERRNRALIITMREAERIFGQCGMMEFRFREISYSAASLALICRRSEIAEVINRAVTGVPS